MVKEFSVQELNDAKQAYIQNEGVLPVDTRSSAISLKFLKDFISKAEKKYKKRGANDKFNAFRIYFVRYPIPGRSLRHIKGSGRGKDGRMLSQVSLALVPVKNFDPVTMKGDDFRLPSDQNRIFAVLFCHPSERNSMTGHCPPLGCPRRRPGEGLIGQPK